MFPNKTWAVHFLKEPLPIFVAQIATIVVLSRAIGLLARRIGQPMVVAEVVAGIVLGPSLMGWALPGFSAALFPKASLPVLGMTSQLGLVLFMFLIGLELDPKLLRGRAKASVAISHSSIFVPFALGAVLALRLYDTLAPKGVPLTPFLLFMGAAMSITAFPVLARILVERRLLQTRVGAITIAAAAVDDVTAWCILAFVVSIARAANIVSAITTVVLAFAYIGFMFYVVRPFLRRLADRTSAGLSPNIVAAILLGLLVSSFITEVIGIHALFGAFLLGVVLPKEGSLARALAEKIEDIVVILLLPLFFAYSGLRTQIGLLDTPGAWSTAGLIIVVACVGKFGGSFVAARLWGMPWRESGAVGILMNTRGLMELIVLNIGLDLGMITPTLFTMMVVMALVTTFMTTPLLAIVYPRAVVANEIENGRETLEPRVATTFTALMCVAYEKSGPGLLNLAAALTGSVPDAARLYALRLVRPADRASSLLEQQHAEGAATLEATTAFEPLVERARELDVTVKPLSFVSSAPGKDICEVADVKRADIVLLGWHKPLFGASMLGGVVRDVMVAAPCDVGVLVDRGLAKIERVLVAYAGSDHDRAALRLARRIVDNGNASLTILHVATDAQEDVARVEATLRTAFFGESPSADNVDRIRFKVVQGVPGEAAIRESEQGYDLLIVGAGRHWGLEEASFGRRAEAILLRAPTSVMVVRRPATSPSSVREPNAKSQPKLEPAPEG